jgi:hypothetical protein
VVGATAEAGEDVIAVDVVATCQALFGLALALLAQDRHQLVVEVDGANRVRALARDATTS